MNSRWQANKIGLINFWYYDEQEFPFVKGRMLLRGSNGSGKSVTMQSVVPLLLDGNMSPERLDPFGSRDRKMSSYLLEEDDGREERTGYLYLEFKRKDSDTYLTVGMGIRARRGKPLDKWYFGLSDGRRIGKELILYKETDEKVTLSKKELENRIGNGGQVFDRQADYMEYVNRQVFGFETVDEYREMIDLLIQLRTPKLSKDFKPSVINDILSDSLQPLSDEDLRPMSEAIENMDNMSMNLKSRQEAKAAAEKIGRVYDKYNRLMLLGKASDLVQAEELMEKSLQKETQRQTEIKECVNRIAELEQQKDQMDAKKESMEKEKDSLNSSNAVNLKTRETELATEIQSAERILEEKNHFLDGKKDLYLDTENRKKEEEDKQYEREQELHDLLEEMADEAEDCALEEHGFLKDELEKDLEKPYSFALIQNKYDKTRTDLEAGLEILRETSVLERQADDLLKRREAKQKEADGAQRRVTEREQLMVQTQNEWKEALYSWNGQNQELKLTPEQLQNLSIFAQQYGQQSDYGLVRQQVADVWIRRKTELEGSLSSVHSEQADQQEQLKNWKKELAEWEQQKEPQPERSEEVIRNRERLDERKIPYQEFYKMLEFGSSLDEKACNRLEEALLRMGILDALVVEEQYRDQVLKVSEGCCDRYLFVQKSHAEHSLLDVLELNENVNDIFTNQRLTGILSCIAYDGDGTLAISSDGTYQMGVLTGTLTDTYTAGFLGTKAREKNRLAKIAFCQKKIAELEAALKELSEKEEELRQCVQRLETEYQAFPGDEDLREAWKMLTEAEAEQKRLQQEAERLENQLLELKKEIQEKKKDALVIADRLYLTCSLEVFQRASQAATGYGRHLTELKSGHEMYLAGVRRIQDLEERMEDLDLDMDQVRRDIGTTEQDLRKKQEEYTSVKEQLQLTDYEMVKERLDACVAWLHKYPSERERCIVETTEKQARVRNLETEKEEAAVQMERLKRKLEYLEQRYQAELALDYVALPEEIKANDGQKAKEICQYLNTELKDQHMESVLQELNKVYFENRPFLAEYQLQQSTLFETLEEQTEKGDPGAKRLDISARYQGVKISFTKLTAHLEEDIAELENLIKDGDRELFEDILANTVSRKIRSKINASNMWVTKMNSLMGAMNTSSGLKLNLRWRSKTAEKEDQLDTRELVDLLKKDYRLMGEEEAAKLSRHFRSKVEEARRQAKDSGGMISFYQVMKDTLDYRKWFEFQLFSQKNGERQKELTNSVFGTFSGGEKAMSMYVPLFSAVVAKYQGGRADAPRLISLDEAFAGVDNRNIRDMFRLMTEFEFDFIINSQVLWGDCDTLDALAIYQLIRPENAKFVTVMPYLWNGKAKEMLESEQIVEERGSEMEE